MSLRHWLRAVMGGRKAERPASRPGPALELLEDRCVPTTGWVPQAGGSQSLFRVWGTGPNDVFAVGNSGTIRHSTNDGQTWTNQNSGTTQFLYGVWGSSSNDVFAVGAGGVIVHSTNDGASWTVQNPATVDLIGVWGNSRKDVFAVGGGGLILHSINDGVSWIPIRPIPSEGLEGVWTNGDNVFAVGAGGTILQSVNDGVSWVAQNSGTKQTLYNIWGDSSNDLFAVGAVGLILHSTNAGASWQAQSSGTKQGLYGLWGSSQDDIFATGGDGVILHSSNDGAAWTPQGSRSTQALDGAWGSGPNDIFAVGAAGTLLHGTGFEAPQIADDAFAVLANHTLWQGSAAGGAALTAPAPIQSVSAVTDAAGLDILFAASTDGRLFEHSPVFANGGWAPLPTPTTGTTFLQLSAATNLSGNAVVFALLSDQSLWEYSSLFAGNHWQMLSIPGSIYSISAVTDASGNDDVYIISDVPGYLGALAEHSPAFPGDGWIEISNMGGFTSLSAGRNVAGQAVVYGVSFGEVWEQNPAFGPIGLNTGWLDLENNWQDPVAPVGTVQSISTGAADQVFAIGGYRDPLWDYVPISSRPEDDWRVLAPGYLLDLTSVSATTTPAGWGEAFCLGSDGSLWEYNPALSGIEGTHMQQVPLGSLGAVIGVAAPVRH
ncbi:MAG TPA: hypothetical protein VMS17_06230 [Gemmataceae bacterium]|nr:hypothetical protein [Gemmataceae bacterium]